MTRPRVVFAGQGPGHTLATTHFQLAFAVPKSGAIGYRFLPKFSGQTMRAIVDAVAKHHGLTVEQLRGPSRKFFIAHPRQEAMWLMRQVKDWQGRNRYSLPQIGEFMGARDHTTILHGVRAHQARVDKAKAEDEAAWNEMGHGVAA